MCKLVLVWVTMLADVVSCATFWMDDPMWLQFEDIILRSIRRQSMDHRPCESSYLIVLLSLVNVWFCDDMPEAEAIDIGNAWLVDGTGLFRCDVAERLGSIWIFNPPEKLGVWFVMTLGPSSKCDASIFSCNINNYISRTAKHTNISILNKLAVSETPQHNEKGFFPTLAMLLGRMWGVHKISSHQNIKGKTIERTDQIKKLIGLFLST